MRELRQVLADLMPDVMSDARFFDPANAKRIEKSSGRLAGLSHSLNADAAINPVASAPADGDLSIPMIAELFQQEARRAHQAFKSGQKRYAQGVLASVPGFCLGCHTRHGKGPELSADFLAPRPQFARKLDQARFEAATRQFDSSLALFSQIIGDPKAAGVSGLDWERASRNALAIAVRVKNDPVLAGHLLDQILSAKDAPYFFREQAKKWKESIAEWKAESPSPITSEDGLWVEAKRLSAKAEGRQKYPMDRSGALDYLRATRASHDLLRAYPNGVHSQDALFFLGVGYEALQDMELWTLDQLYFEACVRRDPHSVTARSCLLRYEEAVYAGFTGSGGTDIPADIALKLDGLRKLTAVGSEDRDETVKPK